MASRTKAPKKDAAGLARKKASSGDKRWDRLYRAVNDYAAHHDATFALHLRFPDNTSIVLAKGAMTKAETPRRRVRPNMET